MKNLFIFLAVMTICGSITKAPIVIQPCSNEVEQKYYLNKKLVHVDRYDRMKYTTGGQPLNVDCDLHNHGRELFKYDSCVTKMYIKTKTWYNE